MKVDSMFSPEYKNKRVVVTGCSSGIGQATARALVDMGAEVIGLSRREPAMELAAFHTLDLASVDSIERATASIDGEIDALFNCAGAPPILSSVDLVKVNFLGPRLLTERLIERMPRGSAIANISSSNAGAWRRNLEVLQDFLSCGTYDAGVAWYEANEEVAGHGYPFSKEAMTVWTMERSAALVPRGIRVNALSPGAVRTPLLDVSENAFPPELLAATLHPSGRSSTVNEQVQPLLFLNSTSASYVNGADLAVDGGYSAAQSSEGPAL